MSSDRISRRAVLAGAGMAVAVNPAAAQRTASTTRAGFEAWDTPPTGSRLPLDVHIHTGERQITLGQWLGGRPAVLALWASWCGPCLVEKPAQAAMAARLARSGARTRILLLQTYDDIDLNRGRTLLTRLGAGGMTNARAMASAERAFIRMFGASEVDETRTSMPWHLLIDADGHERGRALGLMSSTGGQYDYFETDATFEFLRQFG